MECPADCFQWMQQFYYAFKHEYSQAHERLPSDRCVFFAKAFRAYLGMCREFASDSRCVIYANKFERLLSLPEFKVASLEAPQHIEPTIPAMTTS